MNLTVVEVILDGVHMWIYQDFWDQGEGALMPTPTHATDTFGLGMSYAHLMADGRIMRFNEQIGVRSDLLMAADEVRP